MYTWFNVSSAKGNDNRLTSPFLIDAFTQHTHSYERLPASEDTDRTSPYTYRTPAAYTVPFPHYHTLEHPCVEGASIYTWTHAVRTPRNLHTERDGCLHASYHSKHDGRSCMHMHLQHTREGEELGDDGAEILRRV